jgi:nitrogen fixation/metabolism regulation signal transduction histidine kinase
LQNRIPLYFGGALAISTIVLLSLAYGLGRRVSRPIEALTAGIQHFAMGNLHHPIPPTGRGDELDFAIQQFNLMGQKLLAQHERLRVTEQLAAWQDVARAMAHDLKNPLTAMKMALARLERPEPTQAARHEATLLLSEEIDRLLRMTQSFSSYAKLPSPVCKPLRLLPLLEEVALLYRDFAVPVQVASSADPTVVVDGDLLRRALGNLVKNAIEASQPGAGPVLLRLEADASSVNIEVVDDGVGIHVPIEGTLLTRSLGSTKIGGSGLGLPVAYKIIFDHGGNLRLVPGHPHGTRAIVTLPLAPKL